LKDIIAFICFAKIWFWMFCYSVMFYKF
jgi:hypothetical protein